MSKNYLVVFVLVWRQRMVTNSTWSTTSRELVSPLFVLLRENRRVALNLLSIETPSATPGSIFMILFLYSREKKREKAQLSCSNSLSRKIFSANWLWWYLNRAKARDLSCKYLLSKWLWNIDGGIYIWNWKISFVLENHLSWVGQTYYTLDED